MPKPKLFHRPKSCISVNCKAVELEDVQKNSLTDCICTENTATDYQKSNTGLQYSDQRVSYEKYRKSQDERTVTLEKGSGDALTLLG